MLRGTLLPAIATILVVTLGAASAAHGEPTAGQLQTARELFHQAEQLEDAKKWDDALDKLHIVEGIKRTAGVVFHIAWCEEHRGKLVKALRGYQDARALATSDNAQDVLKLAANKEKVLRERVPRIIV